MAVDTNRMANSVCCMGARDRFNLDAIRTDHWDHCLIQIAADLLARRADRSRSVI
jgi:hypothetical protein